MHRATWMAVDISRNWLQSIEVCRQCGDERLAFARYHFGDVAFVEDHAAEHLHIVMPQADETAPAFAANRKGFDEDIVERFACLQSPTEFGGLIPQFFIGHCLVLRLERSDRFDSRLQSLEESRVGRSENAS